MKQKTTHIVKKISRKWSKSILYLAMLILFLKFYFIEQVLEYLEGNTTFFHIRESREVIKREAPVILLCQDYYLPSALHKYNISTHVYIEHTLGSIPNIHGMNKWDLYREFVPTLDQEILFYTKINETYYERLYEGSNMIGNVDVELSEVVTVGGYCIKISTNGSHNPIVSQSSEIYMVPIHGLETWDLLITGKNNWQVLVNGIYEHQTDHVHAKLKLGAGLSILSELYISPTDVKNLDGIENADECMVKELKKANCSFICLPVFLNFLNEHIPFCATNKDYLCMVDHLEKIRLPWLPCYSKKQKAFTKYQGAVYHNFVGYVANNDTSWSFIIRHSSNEMTILKERYIMTTSDFIGSVGGSLGLFLGFSFFSYASDVLDRALNHFDILMFNSFN